MNKTNTKVKSIDADSIAQEIGIEAGDIIVSINDNPVCDVLEYKYLINDEFIIVVVQKPNGEEWEIEIEKEQYEDLGITFEDSLMDEAKSCTNKCIFCFIDQLPKGMRNTMYFKDDDSRLSFLQGNYITLTNLKESDIEKIIKYRISPLNISVHTTNPELRVKMLNNKFAGNINEVLKRLADNGIVLNCQIVLCYGINDKLNLDKTISDLSKLYPMLKSVSVVPVGLTKHRQDLFILEGYDKLKSTEVIEQVGAWQKKFKKRFRTNLVYLADEFYLMAEKGIPLYKEYEDFPQIENGVGLIALFKKEFYDYINNMKKNNIKVKENREISIVTGTSSYNTLNELCDKLHELYPNIKINLYKIINNFFGETVTVSGLITGIDIIEQLKNKELGQILLIPQCMLRSGEEVFLDNVTVKDLEEKLNIKVEVCPVNGKDFIKCILD